jgi:hypothetical protein
VLHGEEEAHVREDHME